MEKEKVHFWNFVTGGLSFETTKESLRNHYKPWGKFTDCEVTRNPASKSSRVLGFVSSSYMAEIGAIMAARSHSNDGTAVKSKCAVAREIQKTWSSCNYEEAACDGIKDNTKEHQRRDYARNVESFIPFEIIADRQTGKKRGIGFIPFDDHDPVDKIVLQKYHTTSGLCADKKHGRVNAEAMDQEASLEEVLVAKEEDVDLGIAIMGIEEDLGGSSGGGTGYAGQK
ncbi:heterogeneous nuclear ribonucleoproteins a2 b1 [Lynx pardinus]|uniref:Heterogeneous nuclear ribonucleoproteins a2 b1 n=1 Tax=Lynx pardinus TaxID=191816 RepID=A0A485PPQ6_LYNPA|nr:heterogeneous nuclear ribonucleoproteins a2 b1 [Lynx pardinus]